MNSADEPKADWELRDVGLRDLKSGSLATEEGLAATFPGCEVKWQRMKGRARPHYNVECNEAEIDVELMPDKTVHSIRTYRPGVTAPSGLGVGSSYRALSELISELVCRGFPSQPTKDNVIYRAHTRCVDPRFPHVAYVFRDLVFSNAQPPAEADSLKIHELRWFANETAL